MITKETKSRNSILIDECGVTAIDTAIFLIAFVVVAVIFAFTILSVGTFLTERGKEAAYDSLQQVRGSMELKGSVVLEATGQYIVFNLDPVSSGSSQDLSKVEITFRDATRNQNVVFSKSASGNCSDTDKGSYPTTAFYWSAMQTNGNGLRNCILGENGTTSAKIVINLGPSPSDQIDALHVFALEIKPPMGVVQLIERTAPAQIGLITDIK